MLFLLLFDVKCLLFGEIFIWHKCFPVNFAKFLRTPFFIEHLWWLILALEDGSIGSGVFVDSQKTFDTVDNQILFAKFNHYGVPGVPNDWFKSYLSYQNQFVSINGYCSGLTATHYGIPQGLLYIIDRKQ